MRFKAVDAAAPLTLLVRFAGLLCKISCSVAGKCADIKNDIPRGNMALGMIIAFANPGLYPVKRGISIEFGQGFRSLFHLFPGCSLDEGIEGIYAPLWQKALKYTVHNHLAEYLARPFILQSIMHAQDTIPIV